MRIRRFLLHTMLCTLFVAASVLPAAAAGPLSLTRTVAVRGVAHDLAVLGQRAYVATSLGLTVLDITDPAAPVVDSSVDFGPCEGIEVDAARGLAYLACMNRGLKVVDISSDPPTVVGTRLVHAWDVAFKDRTVYVASLTGEMYIVDTTTPSNPVLRRTLGLIAWSSPGADEMNLEKMRSGIALGSAKSTGISVQGDHLVAVDWGYGRLYYFTLENPQLPRFAGTFFARYLLTAQVDPTETTAYMLGAYSSTSGIYSIPLTMLDPFQAPYFGSPGCDLDADDCGFIPNALRARGLDQGGFAQSPNGKYLVYVGGRHEGEIHVVNTVDPKSMVEATAWRQLGFHRVQTAHLMGVAIVGDLIYVGAGVLGVQVWSFPGLSAP